MNKIVVTTDASFECAQNERADVVGYVRVTDYKLYAKIQGVEFEQLINLGAGWRWSETKLVEKSLYFKLMFKKVSELIAGPAYFEFELKDFRDVKFYQYIAHCMEKVFSVRILDSPARIAVEDYAFYTQAKEIQFNSAEIEAKFSKLYICPIQKMPKTIPLEGNNTLINNTSKKKKLLLVGYFAGPCKTVGVLRANYWLESIAELSKGEWEVELATAINWSDKPNNVHYVPDSHMMSLLPTLSSDEFGLVRWQAAYREIEKDYAKYVSTLGYFWRHGLQNYFDEFTDLTYDAVIITGNPFSYFDFASYAKEKWSARVLLDYRDPFANNPRFKYTDEARKKARFIEQGYNFQADCILTVNDDCVSYTVNIDDAPIEIIANGFDERKIKDLNPQGDLGEGIHFVHAGVVYYDRSPTALVGGLDRGRHFFHHVGKLDGIEESVLESDSFVSHGVCTYENTLEKISLGHCGVVFVSKSGFETPTKLYDYIAMGLDVLICTIGPLNYGALESVLKAWPRVFWCKNSPEGVREFLESYEPLPTRCEADSMLYSRRHSTEKLIVLLNDLVSP